MGLRGRGGRGGTGDKILQRRNAEDQPENADDKNGGEDVTNDLTFHFVWMLRQVPQRALFLKTNGQKQSHYIMSMLRNIFRIFDLRFSRFPTLGIEPNIMQIWQRHNRLFIKAHFLDEFQ